MIFSNSERGTQMLSAFLFRDLDASKRQIALDIEQERGMNGAIKGFFSLSQFRRSLTKLSLLLLFSLSLSNALFLFLSLTRSGCVREVLSRPSSPLFPSFPERKRREREREGKEKEKEKEEEEKKKKVRRDRILFSTFLKNQFTPFLSLVAFPRSLPAWLSLSFRGKRPARDPESSRFYLSKG